MRQDGWFASDLIRHADTPLSRARPGLEKVDPVRIEYLCRRPYLAFRTDGSSDCSSRDFIRYVYFFSADAIPDYGLVISLFEQSSLKSFRRRITLTDLWLRCGDQNWIQVNGRIVDSHRVLS